MKAEYINPFIKAATNVIETMAFTKAEAGKPTLKQDNKTFGVVTGIIGMTGDSVGGNLILSFDEPSILAIVSKMLMETFSTVNKDVVDAVGELTNMICGGVKSDFSEMGLNIGMATPVMLQGKGLELSQLAKAPIIVMPFKTPEGTFVIEANLAPK
jgi:chemotaxis protein CheX